jgi:hypothetical protein
VRTLAQYIVAAASGAVTIDDAVRQSFDHLLLNAHQDAAPVVG